MNQPLVSVVIGVYNKERHLEQCLRSVLAQTYNNFQLIILDDKSSDNSRALIEQFRDARFSCEWLPVNSGLPAIPRNLGMIKASGKYVAFLDADDVWLPEKLATQVAFMEKNPEYPLSYTACFVIDGDGTRHGIRHEGLVPSSGNHLRLLMKQCHICLSTVMLRKTLFDSVGLFNESSDYLTGEDWEYFWRIARDHPFGFIETPLAEYRKHSGNICKISWNWKGTPRDFLTLNRFWKRPDLWGDRVLKQEIRDALIDAADENAYFYRSSRHYAHVAWFAWRMVCLNPLDSRGWRHLLAAGVRRGA